MAAELCLASVALGPPLLGFAKSVVGVVNDFMNAKRFMDNKRTIIRLEREIDSWKSVMDAMRNSSDIRGSDELFTACETSLLRYRSNIREICRQVKKYNSSNSSEHWRFPVKKVMDLLEELKSQELDVKINKWLTAVGTYSTLDTNNRVRQLQESVYFQQTILNNQRASLDRIIDKMEELRVHPTSGDHLWDIKQALVGLAQDRYQSVCRVSDSSSDDGWYSDMPGVDTVNTTLNDTLSEESKDNPPRLRAPGYVDLSSQTSKATVLPTKLSSNTKVRRSGKIHVKRPENEAKREKEVEKDAPDIPFNQFAEDIDTTESGYALVAGSPRKSESNSVPVLRIREEDWDCGRHFSFDTADPQPVIRLHISLPPNYPEPNSSQSQELATTECNEPTFRTFSIVPLPAQVAKNKLRQKPSMLFTMSSSEFKSTKLALHWDLRGPASRNDIHQRLEKLNEYLRQIELDQKAIGSGLSSSTAAVVYISIPWSRYEQWIRTKSTDAALNALAVEGILAVLPIFVQMRGGGLKRRFWCESEIRHSALYEVETKKSVHAIVQEYSYTGRPFQANEPPEARQLIRFVVLIFRTGDAEEWVDLASSVYTPNLVLSNETVLS